MRTAEETANLLYKRLKTIFNDRDFVIGVMSNASNTEDREEIISFIERGEDVTIENIILLSVHLDEKRV